MREAAQRAVRSIDEGRAGKGFTDTGRRRASQLAAGEEVSGEVVKKMQSYFARHSVGKDASGLSRGGHGLSGGLGRLGW